MMKWVSLVLVVMVAFVFGCAPTVIEGRKVDSEKLSQMTIGQTSKAKVEELFGKPAKTEMVYPGVEKYIYIYREADPEWYTMESTQKQDFEVWFQNGIVQYYKLRSEGYAAVLKQ
jgi:outer membrane protein assembly factor BamE (lipoprotein component of BamABCDE complex)